MSMTTLLEATMLVCFGVAWPLANLRMLRTRRAEGRGLLPASLILCGYLAGIAAQALGAWRGGALAPIFWLYLINALSVALNIYLQYRLGRAPASWAPGLPSASGSAEPAPSPMRTA